MQVKDFQFPHYFLSHEVDLDPTVTRSLLERTVEIHLDGEPDVIVDRGGKLVCYNPSSITKFIFGMLYKLLSPNEQNPGGRDRLALGLFQICKEYVYADFDPSEFNGPPALISFDKLAIPSVIIHELVEPLVGSISDHLVLFLGCHFTDACRIITGADRLQKQYNLSQAADDFPLLLMNCNIHNSAAELAHLTAKYLEVSTGPEATSRIIKSILLDYDSGLLDNLVLILRTLKGEPMFVGDFLRFLSLHASLSHEEQGAADHFQRHAMRADKYLGNTIKIAGESHTPQVFRQWTQWSMLMGLIEKQLSPMRGSMWPTTKALKPHEETLRQSLRENAGKKNKRQLNFEEMLDTVRDLYDHKAIEPGQLIEVVMKDERAWKD